MAARLAFLTGGTGFLGGHVARALCAEGWAIRALARRPDRFAQTGLEELSELQVVRGDLSESPSESLAVALEGCQAVVHVAGLVKARSLEAYREVNLRGTERLLAAASKSAPDALFLLVSSQAAAGPARQGRPVRDGDVARPVSWYGLSKREGEEAVAREWKGPWIIVRPGVVFGPGDRGLLMLFAAAARGWVPVPAARSRIHMIYASQAALGIARAAGRPDLSSRTGFLCDPEPVLVRDLAMAIANLPSRPARLLPLPSAVVRAAGAIQTLREAVTRRSLPFNADKAREILAGDWLCDGAPLARDLTLPPPASLEDGLKKAWDWYLERGWLVL